MQSKVTTAEARALRPGDYVRARFGSFGQQLARVTRSPRPAVSNGHHMEKLTVRKFSKNKKRWTGPVDVLLGEVLEIVPEVAAV